MKPPKAAAPASPRPGTREGKKVLSIFLEIGTLKKLQHLAVDREVTMQTLGEEAVALLLKENRVK